MTEGQGHNSAPALKSLIERIENREAEKRDLAEDIKSIYAEAKAAGFDTKALRLVIRMRHEDFEKRAALEKRVEEYMAALGMLADTELGRSAIARAAPVPAKLPDTDTSHVPFA